MSRPNQFDEFAPFEEQDKNQPEACLVCEALCPDAVDGTLSEAERKAFDKHVATCAHCAQELEDAQRGAAWLGLLKSKAPEPPATLLARILAETTGVVENATDAVGSRADLLPADSVETQDRNPAIAYAGLEENLSPPRPSPVAPESSLEREVGGGRGLHLVRNDKATTGKGALPEITTGWPGKVLAFRQSAQRFGSEAGGHSLHPRLAMTAAMAFFSIALTLNLTGVRLRDFSVEKLQPRALQRSAAEAEASAVRSFQNLRVVYQVESRVSELRQDPMWEDQTESSRSVTTPNKADDDTKPRSRGQD